MKKVRVKFADGDTEAFMEELAQFPGCVDWKADPGEVLEAVDEQLKKIGYEIVVPANDGTDMYFFAIARRKRARR